LYAALTSDAQERNIPEGKRNRRERKQGERGMEGGATIKTEF